MKKLLAVLLAFSMLFAFAACGGKDTDESTTTTTEDIFAGLEDDTTAAVDNTTAAVDDTTAAVDDTTAASVPADATTLASGETTVATTAASAGLNSSDINAVVEYYKAAVAKTDRVTDTESMALADEITGDGALGFVLGVIQPIIESVLADQGGTKERGIPGSDNAKARIQAGDVAKAVASSNNGKTTIAIQLKEQVDGPNANGKTDGPVARAIGTLGNIDGALEALGASISKGRETVKLTYKNATIKVVVDEKTGKIVDGSWKYDIDLDIADAAITMAGLDIAAKNLHTVIAYSVVM